MKGSLHASLLVLLCVPVSVACAQVPTPAVYQVPTAVPITNADVDSLAAQVLASQGNIRDLTTADVHAARARLDSAVADLDALLRRGTAANRNAWRKFLRWHILDTQLAAKQPDRNALFEVIGRFKRNESGLESYTFRKVRRALEDFANTAHYSSEEQQAALRDRFDTRLQGLADALKKYDGDASAENGGRVGLYLRYFGEQQQVPEVIQAIQARYSRPNVYNRVSERLFSIAINRPVTESGPITDTILGTRIRGYQNTTGRVYADLIPSQNVAAYRIVLDGTALSNNVGFNRKFKIYTDGVTQLHVTKHATLSQWGLGISPAAAHATTTSRIRGASGAHLRIVNNFVLRRANQQRGEASAIANQRAEQRAARQFDEQGADLITEANQSYRTRFIDPLLRLDFFPRELRYHSSDHYLYGVSNLHGEHQLAAPRPPNPQFAANSSADFLVQVHESAIANFAELRFAGKTIASDRQAEFRRELSDILPKQVMDWIKQRQNERPQAENPSQITLAATRPYRLLFDEVTGDDGKRNVRIKFVLRGAQFQGASDVKNLQIGVSYLLDFSGDVPKLRRDEAIEVANYFPNREPRDVGVGIRSVIQAALKEPPAPGEPVFDKVVPIDDIQLQGPMAKAGKLRLKYARAGDGWLTLGWSMAQHGSHTSYGSAD